MLDTRESHQVCSECLQGFLGIDQDLTCSTACARDRIDRLGPPLVQAIRDADPDIKITVAEW